MNRLFRLKSTAVATALVGGITLLVPATALANVEVGGTAGVHVFSENNELGVADIPTAASERNSALFGLRLGAFFGDAVGVEGEFGVIPSEARDKIGRAHV